MLVKIKKYDYFKNGNEEQIQNMKKTLQYKID